MKNLLYIFLAFLFFGVDCNKNKQDVSIANCTNNCTIIQGKVTDAISGNPLKNAAISIVWKSFGFPFGSTTDIGTVQTDDYGKYIIKFNYSKDNLSGVNDHYEITANKDGYIYDKNSQHSIQNIYQSDSLKADVPFQLNFSMFPSATLSLTTKRINNIKLDYYSIDYSFTNYKISRFYGDTALNDGTYTLNVCGNKYTVFNVSKKQNGITSSFSDSVFCKSGQMNYYTLNW